MKNKPNPRLINLDRPNTVEKSNTMYYNVTTVIRWDNKKADINRKKHKISFEEAATVFFADKTLEIEDLRHSEQRFIIIGFSACARLLTVVYAYKFEDEIRIISARKATRNEAKKYEERI